MGVSGPSTTRLYISIEFCQTYLWFIPHTLVVSEITGKAAAKVPSPAVKVASTSLKTVIYLVGDMLVCNISHPLVTTQGSQAIALPLLVDQSLQIIAVRAVGAGSYARRTNCSRTLVLQTIKYFSIL